MSESLLGVEKLPVHRVTYSFRSDSGNEYLYDDSSGAIFPWRCEREAALSAMLRGRLDGEQAQMEAKFGRDSADAAISYVRRLLQYGTFIRSGPPMSGDDIAAPKLQEYARGCCRQLILVLTESCNLRCRYCTYSGDEPYAREHTARQMDPQLAVKAIDWFAAFSRRRRLRVGTYGGTGLSFFGGEPLLNMPTLKAALSHARNKYARTFVSVVSTNGTLLTKENASILAEFGVAIGVSVDGPRGDHDRGRVNSSGQGSFDTVVSNLERMRRDYPEYYRSNVRGLCTVDWKTDIEACARFFQQNKDLFPMGVMVRPAVSSYGSYYRRFTPEDLEVHKRARERMWESYKHDLISGAEPSSYAYSLFGSGLLLLHLRARLHDRKPDLLPFSASCVPGMKIAVQVDGTITACERVNGTFPLGNIETGGFDAQRANEMLGAFRRALPHCHACRFSRLCQLCFSILERNGDFRDPSDYCGGEIEASSGQLLSAYVSILERNPTCDFGMKDPGFFSKEAC